MRTVRRPLLALVLAGSFVLAAAACEGRTNPQAPAELEESIEETGPEVIGDDPEGDDGAAGGAGGDGTASDG